MGAAGTTSATSVISATRCDQSRYELLEALALLALLVLFALLVLLALLADPPRTPPSILHADPPETASKPTSRDLPGLSPGASWSFLDCLLEFPRPSPGATCLLGPPSVLKADGSTAPPSEPDGASGRPSILPVEL